jgi:hypothetical protein
VNLDAVRPARPDSRALALTRLAWFVMAPLLIVPMLISWVFYINLLRQVCDSCPITPELLETLTHTGVSLRLWIFLNLVVTILVGAGWLGVGLVIFILRPFDRRAVLMSLFLMLVGPGLGGVPFALTVAIPAWMFFQRTFSYLSVLGLLPLLILFPNGRLAPRWSLWPVLYLFAAFFPNAFLYGSRLDFGTWPIQIGLSLVIAPFLLTMFIVPVYRYRKVFTLLERQQTRWALVGFVLAGIGIILTVASLMVGSGVNRELPIQERTVIFGLIQTLGYGLSPLMIPIFIGMAILRSQLWDIDIFIRRTLVYSLVTAILGLLYLGMVTVLQSLFTAVTGQSSALSLVLSTLVIAALFNPLRRHIQDVIDRRFYRQKYNAEQALAGFSALASRETDLDELTRQVADVVEQTVQPEQVSLWLRRVSNHVQGNKA